MCVDACMCVYICYVYMSVSLHVCPRERYIDKDRKKERPRKKRVDEEKKEGRV